jgi:hypothetical protein
MILFAIVKRERAKEIQRVHAFDDELDSGMARFYSKIHPEGILVTELPEYPGPAPWPTAIVAIDFIGRLEGLEEGDGCHWWVIPAEVLRYQQVPLRVFTDGTNDPLFADDRLADDADDFLVRIKNMIGMRRGKLDVVGAAERLLHPREPSP